MMLDLPELFAPASTVSGLTSIDCSSTMDLKPATEIFVIPSGFVGEPVFFGAMGLAISLPARRLLLKQRGDERLELGARLLADDLLSDAALAVYDEGRGEHADGVFGGHTVVAERDGVVLPHVFLILADEVGGVARRDADHAEAARGEAALHLVEAGDFRAAGDAPGRPEVQEHDLPAQFTQLQGLAVGRLQVNVRRWLSRDVVRRTVRGVRRLRRLRCSRVDGWRLLHYVLGVRQVARRDARDPGQTVGRDHQADDDEQHARSDLDFVQVSPKPGVEAEELVEHKSRDEERHGEARSVEGRKHESVLPAAARRREADDASEYGADAGRPAGGERHP